MHKKTFLFAFIILSLSTQAQRDTTRIDSTLAGLNQGVAELIHAPVLRRTESQIRIVPHQQFCFDVMMEVELNFGRTSLLTAVFINTTDGYIGYTRPQRGGAITVLMPEKETFNFTVISYKMGNVYMFHNRKASRGEGLDHLVSTSNTEAHDYRDANLITSSPLMRKTESRNYCNGKMRATAYKRSNGPTIWFIYGAEYDANHIMPNELTVQKYIGGYGVGIIQTDWGAFIVPEQTNGVSYSAIKSIQRVHVCFDPSEFKMMEADYYAKQTQDFRDESAKIDKDEAEITHHHHCQTEEMALIQFRREELQKAQQNIRVAKSGNLLQDRNAQKAILGDPSTIVQEHILQTKINICHLTNGLSEHPNDASIQDKLACENQLLGQLQSLIPQMQQMDRQYTNIAEANAHKSALMLTVHGCD